MSDRNAWHPDPETLNRYVDGRLDGDAARRIDRHLEECAPCRAETGEIRDLLRRAAELPRGIEPARDLWAGVEARIRWDGAADAGTRWSGPWLAAAAAVLVALTAGATLWIAGGPRGSAGPESGPVASGAATDSAPASLALPVELAAVEAGYRPVVDRLTAVVDRRSDRLPPEARAVVERNLRIIDAAIAEAESALARHPTSPELVRALDRSYQRKIDLLRRSARLTTQM